MPTLKSLIKLGTSFLASQQPLQSEIEPTSTSSLINQHDNDTTYPSCPVDSPLSCHNADAEPTCCYVAPGGQFLLTQFWDTNPSVGPVDSWTLHGLWPDNCDGTYPQFCHISPAYTNLTQILTEQSPSTLEFMNEYWLPNRGSPASFWFHEWSKHGTCINTLAPSCYTSSSSSSSHSTPPTTTTTNPSYTPGLEAVHYFTTATTLFKTLDSYTALAAHDIYPSFERRWKRSDIETALRSVTGKTPVLGCTRGGVLNEIWYGFNVRGSVQGGEWVAAEPVGKSLRSRCPVEGVRWLPKI